MMEEVICLILYLITEFVNYTLSYDLIFQCPVTKQKKRWFFSCLIVFVIHMAVLYFCGMELSFNISIFTMIIVPLCLLESGKIKKFLIYFFVVFISATVISCSLFLLAGILQMPESRVRKDEWLMLICQAVPMVLLLLLYVYMKIRNKEEIRVQLGIWQYVLIFICLRCITQSLGSIQLLSEGNLTQENINDCGIGVSISGLFFILLILGQGIFMAREIQLKERNRNNEEFIKVQTESFEQAMLQDEKMRRFRHDMNAHIAVLKLFCGNNDNGELETYLNTMVKESAVYDMEVYTGNKNVDAVIRPLVEEARKKEIHFEIQGNVPEDIKVSAYDLCTIISNLLRNAIESCEKIESISSRVIKLNVGTYQSLIFLTIENTVKEEIHIKDNHLVTSKKDTKYHGLGSGNVKAAVKKYNGRLSYHCEDGWFKSEIQL